MRLSQCRTLEDLEKFVPTNQERLYYSENGDSYGTNAVKFLVSDDKKSFLALPRSFCYGYGEPLQGEFFNDEQEAVIFIKEKKAMKRKEKIESLKTELARLEREDEE